tara:strand:- start:217 stop:1131 length:915 start_codon:yes stop_codon:yes gene_type:complete
LLFLLSGVTFLAFQDTLIKFISDYTSFWQIQVLRSLGNMLLIIIFAFFSVGLRAIYPKQLLVVCFRSFLLVFCMFFFFAAAPFLSISQMAAGLYTYPLFVSMLAIPFLGEKIGRWRFIALLVGALGAALTLDLFDEDFSRLQLFPIAAGFFYACNIMVLRRYCRHESILALTFFTALAFFLSGVVGISFLYFIPFSQEINISLPFVTIGWPDLTLLILLFATLASVLNLLGNLGLTRAYQTAESSFLAPADFSYLIFIAICGKLFFGSWPTPDAFLGMALIATAGIIIVWQERHSDAKLKQSRV